MTLLNALGKAENAEPGFLLELVTRLLQHHHYQQQQQQHQLQQQHSNMIAHPESTSASFRINMTESLLRLQANIPEIEEQRCRRLDEPFQELNRKTFALKKILSRIPDEIDDRKVFLETIKEIASAIKKLLDCVNEITAGGYLSSYMDKRAVEGRKREFIKDSKNFSQTLKEFFKGGHEQAVFQSAAQLIYATNSIQKTIKSRCDQKN